MSTVITVPPCWRIVPPGLPAEGDGLRILLSPGEGFGDGLHATTQVCLQAIAALLPGGWPAARDAQLSGDAKRSQAGGDARAAFADAPAWRMLDFGSGTGILAIGAARLGAEVVGVEIDEAGIATAEANSALNGACAQIRYTRSLDDAPGPFDLVVANILRPVLLAFADALVARLAPGGLLILSGLVVTDVPDLSVRYAALLGGQRPEVYTRGDWCALAWRSTPARTA